MTMRVVLMTALLLANLFSAVAVVKVKQTSRDLQHQLQVMRVDHDQLKIKWAQLRLEESTWASYDRVRRVARTRLDMYLPKHYTVLEPQP